MSAHRYAALDGLRGVAAAVVVALHCALMIGGVRALPHGHLAVDFFFMLSGFVLTYAYQAQIRERRLSFMGLVKRRLFRLHPMIVLGVVLGLTASLIVYPVTLVDAMKAGIAGLGPVPVWAPTVDKVRFPANPPTWSLFFEYIASFSMIFLAAAPDFVLVGVALIGAGGMIWKVEQTGTLDVLTWWGLYGGLARVAFAFPLGMLIYRHRDAINLPKVPTVALCLALIALAFLPPSGWLELAIVFVAFPLIVSLGVNATAEGRAWAFAGVISYPLYAVHLPLLRLMHGFTPDAIKWPVAAVGFVLSFALAALALRFWDEPIRRSLGRIFPNLPRDTATALAPVGSSSRSLG